MQPKVDVMFEDQETVINYCKYHIGEWAEVYSTDKVIMKRYEKFMNAHPELCKLIKEDKYSMTFSVDPRCACLQPRAPRKGVPQTEEQRAAAKERFAQARNARSLSTSQSE